MKAFIRYRTFDNGISEFYTEGVAIHVESADELINLRTLRTLLVSSDTPTVGISLETRFKGLRDYVLNKEGVAWESPTDTSSGKATRS